MSKGPLNYPQRKRNADNTKGTTPTRDLNATQRVQMALQLRAQRLSWDEIAVRAGYGSRGAAHKAVMRELQRNVSPDVENMRREELHMLDGVHQEMWGIMTDKKVFPQHRVSAANTILAISERKARLFGLDIPVDSAALSNVVVVREVPSFLGLTQPQEQAS